MKSLANRSNFWIVTLVSIIGLGIGAVVIIWCIIDGLRKSRKQEEEILEPLEAQVGKIETEAPEKVKGKTKVSTVWLVISLICAFIGFVIGIQYNIVIGLIGALIGFMAPTIIYVFGPVCS